MSQVSDDLVDGGISEGVSAADETEAPREGAPQDGTPETEPSEPEPSAMPPGTETEELTELQQMRRQNDRFAAVLGKRHQKLLRRVESFRAEKQQTDALRGQVLSDLKMLRSGDGQRALETLGRMTGKDPVKLYEEMSLAILAKGPGRESTEVLALKEQVTEMKAHLGSIQDERLVQEGRRALIQHAQDAERWPRLAATLADDPAGTLEALEQYIEHEYAGGRRATIDGVMNHAELALMRHQGSGEGATRPRAAAAFSVGAAPVGGRHSDVAGSRREKSREEDMEEAAELLAGMLFK